MGSTRPDRRPANELEARVSQHGVDPVGVSAADHGLDIAGDRQQHPDRRVRRLGVRLPGLLLPAPRIALLRPATSLGPALHIAAAHLGGQQPPALEDPDRIAAAAHQQRSDPAISTDVVDQRHPQVRMIIETAKRRPYRRGCPVRRRHLDHLGGAAVVELAVALGEPVEPAGQSLRVRPRRPAMPVPGRRSPAAPGKGQTRERATSMEQRRRPGGQLRHSRVRVLAVD